MATPSTTPPIAPTSSAAPEPPTTSAPPPSSSNEPSTPPSSSVPPPTTAPPSEGPSSGPTSSAGPSNGPSASGSEAPPSNSASPSAGPSNGPSSAGPSSAGPTSHSASASGGGSGGASVVTSILSVTVTDANGNVHVTTSEAVSTLPASKGSKSNTGAIVGGVVGGVGGLIVILAIAFFLFRKRRKSYRDDFDDMMFDPARPQNHAAIDLSDTGGAPVVDPYNYQSSSAGVASTNVTSPQTSQFHGGPVSQVTHSNAGFESRSHGTSSATSTAGYAGFGAGGGYGAQTLNAFPEAVATGTGPEMSAKQREAYEESQRFRVQNVTSPTAGPSGAGSPPAPVTVHQDGGAFVDADASGVEIPPTYDSIRR